MAGTSWRIHFSAWQILEGTGSAVRRLCGALGCWGSRNGKPGYGHAILADPVDQGVWGALSGSSQVLSQASAIKGF